MKIRTVICISLSLLPVLATAANLSPLDQELRELIIQNKLDGEFVSDHKPAKNNAGLVSLGGELFFSPDLSIDGKVACISCHSIDKGGADGTALTVGLGAKKPESIGDKRVEEARQTYHDDVVFGLITRNSPTVFNAALYRKNLFWDGRAEYTLDDAGNNIIKAGFDLAVLSPTAYENQSLLQTQARMPLTSPFEMKGGMFTEMNNFEIEQEIVNFLRSNNVWCEKFNKVFQEKDCNKSVTLSHLTKALAEYESTLVFVDSPFQKYIEGNSSIISDEAKKGAVLFLKSKSDGGLGCVGCHYGKILSSEKFYSLGIYSSGVGANQEGFDFGRRNVDRMEGKFRFKNPSLLNISETAPYFHNGIAANLEQAVRYHVQDGQANKSANTIKVPKVNHDSINAIIEAEFRQNNSDTRRLLPQSVTDEQMASLLAFLNSLTDPCITSPECLAKFKKEIIVTARKPLEKADIVHSRGKPRVMDKNAIKQAAHSCSQGSGSKKTGNEKLFFTAHDADIGIDHQREVGLVKRGWLVDVINHGGLSVADVNGDCLDDVIFDAGEKGLVFYVQKEAGNFARQNIPLQMHEGAITPLIMDLDGDYKQDLFVGNSGKGSAFIAFDFLNGEDLMLFNTLRGPVINASIADIDNDGDMDMAMAFWRSYKSLLQDNIWTNDGNGNLLPKKNGLSLRESDTHASDVSGKFIVREPEIPFRLGDASFTPNFADIDRNGTQDLLLAADFVRSQVLRNEGGNFVDITRKDVIDESNGMGAAVGDFDNDGLQDWYITSINLKNKAAGGNSLYRNTGKGIFEKMHNGATVLTEDAWSWGACTADFNNDGYLDIFYVSGYGEEFRTARYETLDQKESNQEYLQVQSRFRNSYPKMLVNNGKGGFADQSFMAGLDKPFDGRGIACFDFEQDGDIDILVNPVEGKPRLYKNEMGGKANWISLRIVGLPGNTDAIGTRVTLQTKSGKQYREVRFENNYLSRNPAQLHFGLGDIKKVDKIIIEFPAPASKTIVLEKPEINKLHLIYQSETK